MIVDISKLIFLNHKKKWGGQNQSSYDTSL